MNIFKRYIKEESAPKTAMLISQKHIEVLLSKVADEGVTDVSELKVLCAKEGLTPVPDNIIRKQLDQFREIVLLCEKIIKREAVKSGTRDEETNEWIEVTENYAVPMTLEKLKEVAW